MPEAVVDLLELVEVEDDRGEGLAARARLLDRLLQPLAQQRAVRQAGELVMAREPPQRELAVFAFDRVADRAPQRVARHLPLDEVVLRARLDGPQRPRFVLEPAADDQRHVRDLLADATHHLHPAGVGQVKVRHDHVDRLVLREQERVSQRADVNDPVPRRPQLGDQPADQARVARVVFDQQQRGEARDVW